MEFFMELWANQLFRVVFVLMLLSPFITVGYLLVNPLQYISASTRTGQRNRKKIRQKYVSVSRTIYNFFDKNQVTHIFVKNTHYMFQTRYCLDDMDARVSTGRTIAVGVIIAVGSFIVSLSLLKDTLLSAIMAYMITVLVNYKVRGSSTKFVYELNETIGDMLHYYNSGGKNIQIMFEKLEGRINYMTPYLRSMREYLIKAKYSDEPNVVIADYSTIAPSRFLRLIFNYLYITERYGDASDLFNVNMTALQREIHAEYLISQQIDSKVAGEIILNCAPVGMLPVMEWYMKNYFVFGPDSFITTFLSTSSGYAVKVLCAMTTLICFYCHTSLLHTSDTVLETKKFEDWADYFLLNDRRLSRNLKKFSNLMPKFFTKYVMSLQEFDSGKTNIQAFYYKGIIFALILSMLTAGIVTIDTIYQRSVVDSSIYAGVSKEMMDYAISVENDPKEFVARCLANDRIMIKDLNENGFPENMIWRMRELGLNYGLYAELAETRVGEKFRLLSHTSIPILIVIIITAAVFGAVIPLIDLGLTVKLKKGTMLYNEVMGFYTVTILLISHPQSTVFMLVQWLTQFSQIFKQRLQSCVDDFREETISEINRNILYVPLNRLVDCILLAKKGVSKEDAFAGITQKYRFQEEERAVVNAKVVNSRTGIVSAITWISLGASFGLYLILPMIITIYDMTTGMM